jgi:hypothetical protein
VSEDQVCLQNNITKLSSGRDEYPLMSQKKENCVPDSRFTLINSLNELKYFKINKLDFLPD